MKKLKFQQIVDERFGEDLPLLQERMKAIEERLSALPGVNVLRDNYYRLDWPETGNEAAHFQYRVNYYIEKNTRAVTWNDIMIIVNDVRPVPYDWVK